MIDPKELQKQIDKGFEVEKDDELVIDHIKIDYLTDEVSYLKYLVDRGYSLNTLKDFEVGYSKVKERVVIPVRDSSYKLIAFIGRAIEQDQVPKYLYTSGFKRKLALFNIQNAKQYDSVIVCEGSLDCLKIHQAGFSNCVSTLGAKVSEEQIKMLRRNFDTIMIFSDNDEAGEAMRSAIINGCQGKEMYVLDIPDGCKDPGEMTEEQIQESFLNKKQA
jgi:DNA primase